MKKLYPKRFMFLLDEEIYQQLKKLSELESRSMGEIIRLLIKNEFQPYYPELEGLVEMTNTYFHHNPVVLPGEKYQGIDGKTLLRNLIHSDEE